jgi:small-conductance mechanosensitive channel
MAEPKSRSRIFETRSHSWRQAGLIRQLNPQVVKRARLEALVFVPAFVAVLLVNDHRASLFGTRHHPGVDALARAATVIALLILGWLIARDVGRALGPTLFRRMDPATAGTVGFLMRLGTAVLALLIALDAGGVNLRTLLVGGAFTAVIVGLAAQQTLGNVFAGLVLLSAHPFRVGDRVRIQAGGLGGQLEGVVSSLGLLYTVLASGDDAIMLPNSGVLNAAIVPLREPDSVDLRARLRPGVTPGDLQELLEAEIDTPLRDAPRITLEELDGEEVVVRIAATPRIAADGPRLATELLEIVSRETRAGDEAREAGDGGGDGGDGAGDGGAGDGNGRHGDAQPAPPAPPAPVRGGPERR